MILWTIQNKAVWEKLETDGTYTASDRFLGFPPDEDDAFNHSHYAYLWLIDQMKNRIGLPPEGVVYPIWAWYKQHSQSDGKPDMRRSHYLKGHACVRMKLDIPDYEVLLSDFDEWHCALNYWFLSETEKESDEFDAWCGSLGVDFQDIRNWNVDSSQLREVRAKIEKSWELMLGVRKCVDEDWHFSWSKRSIQATFWVLRRENVLSVEHFISR